MQVLNICQDHQRLVKANNPNTEHKYPTLRNPRRGFSKCFLSTHRFHVPKRLQNPPAARWSPLVWAKQQSLPRRCWRDFRWRLVGWARKEAECFGWFQGYLGFGSLPVFLFLLFAGFLGVTPTFEAKPRWFCGFFSGRFLLNHGRCGTTVVVCCRPWQVEDILKQDGLSGL